jgi:hypothetical protein
MKNAVLGTLACKDFTSMNIWNEVKEGTERGLDETTGHYNWECKAALPCEVTNERGVEKEGTFATVEGPPTFQETEKKARRTGNTSVPWPGELIETEKAVYDLIHHVRLWAVVPLGTEMGGPGKGPGCVLGGSEIPFEDQEGLTEKAAGDEIKAQVVNGQKNGMDPSKLRFEGEKPETGRLISQASGPLYMTGEVKGPSGETDYELVQAR